MSTSHWPPLPVPSASEEGKKLLSGYSGDFTKYSKDQFVSIICALNTTTPNPKFDHTESPAILENGLIHSDLEILKPIPNGVVVEFLEAKQKNKPKGHKHPSSKNESSGTYPSGSGATVTSHPNTSGDSKEPSAIVTTETPVSNPSSSTTTTSNNPPATVWPAIDSSSVKTPPPPNHQSKKPPPPKQQRKPAATAPATPNEKLSSHPNSAQSSHSKPPPPSTAQKSKDQQQPPKSKHFPAKHQKKQPQSAAAHPESHSGNKPATAEYHHAKSPEKENVLQTASGGGKEIGAAKENQGPAPMQASKEKSDSVSTPSYADIARSTTPTNSPSNTIVSD
jgi:hypothetical protein